MMTDKEHAEYRVLVSIARDLRRAKIHPLFEKVPSNAQTLKQNEEFKTGCELAGIPATVRQASKFSNKKGAAYRAVQACK